MFNKSVESIHPLSYSGSVEEDIQSFIKHGVSCRLLKVSFVRMKKAPTLRSLPSLFIIDDC